jgi:hypothetical protein
MIKMSSVKKPQSQEKFLKTGKKINEPRKSLQQALSPTVSSVKSPIRIIKTMKSQSNIFYPKKVSIKRPVPTPLSPTYTITIKSVEKKVDLLKDSEEPSPIISKSKKGFYSMTEEEYKDFNLFLKEMNK